MNSVKMSVFDINTFQTRGFCISNQNIKISASPTRPLITRPLTFSNIQIQNSQPYQFDEYTKPLKLKDICSLYFVVLYIPA